MLHAPLHSSDEGRQGAGHKLHYHFTLSGLCCMNMQSHSITVTEFTSPQDSGGL